MYKMKSYTEFFVSTFGNDPPIGGMPRRVRYSNGNVARYVYSAAGDKLRVVHQTAVPNITVAIGSARELGKHL